MAAVLAATAMVLGDARSAATATAPQNALVGVTAARRRQNCFSAVLVPAWRPVLRQHLRSYPRQKCSYRAHRDPQLQPLEFPRGSRLASLESHHAPAPSHRLPCAVLPQHVQLRRHRPWQRPATSLATRRPGVDACDYAGTRCAGQMHRLRCHAHCHARHCRGREHHAALLAPRHQLIQRLRLGARI